MPSTDPPSGSNSRRHPRSQQSSLSGTVSSIATTAVAAYGAYRVYQYYSSEQKDKTGEAGEGLTDWISSLLLGEEQEGHSIPTESGSTQDSHLSMRPKSPAQNPVNTQRSKELDPRTRQRLAKQWTRKCRGETRQAFVACWPDFQRALEEATDTSETTKELKELRLRQKRDGEDVDRARQDELWHDIHIQTLTRWVATAYFSSLLFLSLTMQLNWVGGEVFRQGQDNISDLSNELARRAKGILMETQKYAVTQGLPILMAAIRRALDSALDDWTATTYVSSKDIEGLLRRVNNYLERGPSSYSSSQSRQSRSRRRNWTRLLLPDPTSGVFGESSASELEELMLEALWDLAESPAWQDAQEQAVDTTRKILRKIGWGKLFDSETTFNKEKATSNSGDDGEDTSVRQLPLAQVMAPFKTSSDLLSPIEGDAKVVMVDMMSRLEVLPTVLELAEISFQEF